MTEAFREDVWRDEAPHVLTALLRRSGDFEACEDAVQEALLAAAQQWPRDGVPENPRGWLVRVASRKLVDERRARDSRLEREMQHGRRMPADAFLSPSAAELAGASSNDDDTVQLLLLCAHPALSDASRVALTLRAVAGLSTAQVAAGFLVPESTMAQRISRAKATIRAAGARFDPPTHADLGERLHAVRHVLYLVFTAGHTTSAGDRLVDVALAQESIRLAERLHRATPEDNETAGLLALLLLTHSRTAARVDGDGDLVPLGEQDRTLWDRSLVARGTALVESALAAGSVGPFQFQAAIAAVHAEAIDPADTDWLQITMLYRMLDRLGPSPAVALSLAVAIGMAHGAQAGLEALAPLMNGQDKQLGHRLHAAEAHLLERAGQLDAARDAYARAARLTQSIPEQRYLNERARACRTESRRQRAAPKSASSSPRTG